MNSSVFQFPYTLPPLYFTVSLNNFMFSYDFSLIHSSQFYWKTKAQSKIPQTEASTNVKRLAEFLYFKVVRVRWGFDWNEWFISFLCSVQLSCFFFWPLSRFQIHKTEWVHLYFLICFKNNLLFIINNSEKIYSIILALGSFLECHLETWDVPLFCFLQCFG